MNIVYKSWGILALMFIMTIGSGQPRVIKGTVYSKDGKKVAGVIVTAHKSKEKYYTSFDGFYEINANIKSKWIKFTFPDRVEKLNIEGINRDVIDFGEDGPRIKPDTIKVMKERSRQN
jgi:hypothetical protein